jgi:hypothetical protein
VERLIGFSLVYLGTPYSKYKRGIEAAWRDASELAGKLLLGGVNVYSPIAHTHSIAKAANIDPLNHDVWLPFDMVIMSKSEAMVVGMLDGWPSSFGVKFEIDQFRKWGRPVFAICPSTLKVVELP